MEQDQSSSVPPGPEPHMGGLTWDSDSVLTQELLQNQLSPIVGLLLLLKERGLKLSSEELVVAAQEASAPVTA